MISDQQFEELVAQTRKRLREIEFPREDNPNVPSPASLEKNAIESTLVVKYSAPLTLQQLPDKKNKLPSVNRNTLFIDDIAKMIFDFYGNDSRPLRLLNGVCKQFYAIHEKFYSRRIHLVLKNETYSAEKIAAFLKTCATAEFVKIDTKNIGHSLDFSNVVSELARIVDKSSFVTEFILDYESAETKVDREPEKALIKAITKMSKIQARNKLPPLKTFALGSPFLSTGEFNLLVTMIKNNPHIENLHLGVFDLNTDKQIEQISKSINSLKKLKSLKMCGFYKSKTLALANANTGINFSNIEELELSNFSGNQELLTKILQSAVNVKKLSITDKRLIQQPQAFYQAIGILKNLEYLDLHHAELTKEEVLYLLEQLHNSQKLKFLGLGFSNIDDKGLKELDSLIKKFPNFSSCVLTFDTQYEPIVKQLIASQNGKFSVMRAYNAVLGVNMWQRTMTKFE